MPVKPHGDYRLNKPFLTPIIEIMADNARNKTFVVNYNPIPDPIIIHPGQFVMVWVPGIDEIPMSVSKIGPDSRIEITVAKVGEATTALHALQEGDLLGIRGPYGNWYQPKEGEEVAIVIGGGVGMASVRPVFYDLVSVQNKSSSGKKIKIIGIEGAKTQAELIFHEELTTLLPSPHAFHVSTDDGSIGFHGFATELLKKILKEELETLQKRGISSDRITVFACGPEIMLQKIYEICEESSIHLQVSLERMMRCGFGLCGLCALEPTGLLVCKDGPVFLNHQLREMTDFGQFHRDFSGKPYKI
ncbi:MAG: dihydroorotate dehydrogenase electron transfer subunit [Promethearchaeota archaeon]